MITVTQEPLSWEMLRYWKRTHPEELGCPRPAPIFVARRDGRVVGFAVLDADPIYTVPVVGLFADNLWIGLRLCDAMEDFLARAGFDFYLFGIDPHLNYGFLRIIERLGLSERIMVDTSGRVWFKRVPKSGSPRVSLAAVA